MAGGGGGKGDAEVCVGAGFITVEKKTGKHHHVTAATQGLLSYITHSLITQKHRCLRKKCQQSVSHSF